MKIQIPENTDLNDFIKSLNNNDHIELNEETLKFDQSIYDLLPYPLNNLNKVIKKSSKCDMSLLAIIAVFSGMVKKYKVQYGEKQEGCQLYVYILANPGQGKGIAAKIKDVGITYHKAKTEKFQVEIKEYKSKIATYKSQKEEIPAPIAPVRQFLYCAANNTKAALFTELADNNGYGVIYETEADTLFTANSSDFGSFSDMLRLGYHGEACSVNRKYLDVPIEIDELHISVFLTSTLNQCFKLIRNYEDGLFSRFAFYFLPSKGKFESVYDENNANALNAKIKEIENAFFAIAKTNEDADVIEFFFSNSQKEQFKVFFEGIDLEFKNMCGERLSGNINRFGLMFTRICMLLSYLRKWDSTDDAIGATIECDPIDFEIATSIVGKLFHHLQIIDYLYETKNTNQKSLVSIPTTTDTKSQYTDQQKREAIRLVKSGLSQRTVAERILNNKSLQGTVNRWKKLDEKGAFPFPETETGKKNAISINVRAMLKKTVVSVFKNVKEAIPIQDSLSLFELLTSDSYKHEVETIRSISNPNKRKFNKEKLLAFTASGEFKKKRLKGNLQKHSGFICIDIDEKGNESISNFDELKKELAKITNVAFCAHSVSGSGYFLLIPIEEHHNHELYFEAIYAAFKQLGIEIDKACKDVSRLRIISYDDDYYMASKAYTLTALLKDENNKIDFIKIEGQRNNRLELLLKEIEANKIDITQDYEDWFSICCALANELGEKGRRYFHLISKFYSKYNFKECQEQYNSCLRGENKKYTLGTLYFIAKKYDILG